MAGGMGAGLGVPIGERPVKPAVEAVPGSAMVSSTTARRPHDWVRTGRQGEAPYAGLVIEQARAAHGWMALTVYVVPGPTPHTVLEWLPSTQLTPVAASSTAAAAP